MKKKYLFTLAAGLICTLTAHAQETALPDSLYSYDENNQLFSKVYYQYNDKGKKISQENYNWNEETNTWENVNTWKYEYDEKGRYLKIDIISPFNYQEGIYTPNGNYYTRIWTTTSLDGTVTIAKGAGEYDNFGNIAKDTTYLSNGNDSWYMSGITEYTYDTENRQTSYTITYYNTEGKATDVNKGIYTYTGTGDDYVFEYSYQSDNSSNSYKTKTETTPGNPEKVDYYYMGEGETEWTYQGPDYKYYPSSTPDANTQIRPESTIKVYGTDGAIRIELTKAALVEVYNISGQRLYAQVVDGTINIPVATGIYIVRAANEVTKVSIRK